MAYKHAKQVLNKALEVICGPREESYGDFVQNSKDVSVIAGTILGRKLPPEVYPAVMIAAKIVRETHKHGIDNLIDHIGYVALYHELVETMRREAGEVERCE